LGYLFIGLFVIALLAGFVTIETNRDNNSPGWLGSISEKVGFKQVRARQKSRTQKIFEDLREQRLDLMENMRDQQDMLKQAEEQRRGLSKIVEDLSDKNDSDMLRLKSMLDDFADKNRLLIERGRELIRANQEQIKTRQQALEDATDDSDESDVRSEQFTELAEKALQQRRDFINQSLDNVRNLREQTESLSYQLKIFEDNLPNPRRGELPLKMAEIKNKNDQMLINLKNKEERVRQQMQYAEINVASQKEKMNSFIDRNTQRIEEQQHNLDNQNELMKERAQSQLQRLKERQGN
jgi:hypothetical protein